MRRPFSRRQKLTIISGIVAVVAMITLLQLWLLSATMNALPGRRRYGHSPGGARERRLPRLEPRPAPLPVSAGAPLNVRMESIRTLHPAYFALVMATGIVSIGAQLMGLRPLALALLVVNVAAFASLWILTAIRVARFRREVMADLSDHQRGVGFFTAVAATSVFGSQLVIVLQQRTPAAVLWIATFFLWAVLVYAVFTALTVKEDKPSLDRRDQRRLARRGRRDGIRVDARIADRAGLRRQRGPAPVRGADLLARRRNALHLADLAHLLSLHLLPFLPDGPHAAVLDQHGRHGDLDARRRASAR